MRLLSFQLPQSAAAVLLLGLVASCGGNSSPDPTPTPPPPWCRR
ncbi:hypothetical protein [Hymenobacter sp. 5414T-23]|nr:hypothetical protein [Hymenobacter sp. 5414T-23]